MEYSTFLATAKEKAAERMSGGANIFDLTDTDTLSYASSLVARVTESAGCKIEELFGLTAEDFCQHISESQFNEVKESTPDVSADDLTKLAGQISEDAVSLFGLFSDYGDDRVRLVDTITNVQESAAAAEGSEAEGEGEAVAEGAEEGAEEGSEAVAEGSEAEGEGEAVAEGSEAEGEGEAVAEGSEAEGEGEAVAEGAEAEGEGEAVAEGAAAAEGEEEGAAEGEEPAAGAETITIVPASEKVHEGAWGEVDKGALKSRLRTIKEAGGEGIDAVIQDTYAVVGSIDDSSTWKYPHHVLEGADLLLSPAGVATAAGYLQGGRFSGTEEQKQFASEHLGRHYGDMDQEIPEGLSAVQEGTIGARMISLEVVGEKENDIVSFEQFAQTEGFDLAVVEAVVNSVRESGFVTDIKEPTLIAISRDQLSAMKSGLETISSLLMGKVEPGTQVAESAISTDELNEKLSASEATIDELNGSLSLHKSKMEALLVLIEGSALEGIGESVMKAETIDQVGALKTVSETPGLKRLITANVLVTKEDDSADTEIVSESGGAAASLSRLSKVFEAEDAPEETSSSQKKGVWAGNFV